MHESSLLQDIATADNLIPKKITESHKLNDMSSIITEVFKTTIVLVVNKVRDEAAERLREGDVIDQRFRGLIVRELDDIKSKLDGLSRNNLLASISFFKEGIELLYEVLDKDRCRGEGGEVAVEATCAEPSVLAEKMRNVELTNLDKSATTALANAKKRFEVAREDATRAFNNEALSTSDRILAMEYRVMATILETVDNPAAAMAPCRVCIKELNCLPAVKNCFNVQLRRGITAVKAFFSKEDRRKIISSVCHVNRVIFDVTKVVGKEDPFWMWPTVDTGEECVDALRDGRMFDILYKQDMKHCFVPTRLFVQEVGKELDFIDLCGIAANSKGQFIIGDNGDKNVKVLDRRGQCIGHFSLPGDVDQDELKWHDVASDINDNIYVLVEFYKPSVGGFVFFVYKLNYTGELLHKFFVKASGHRSRSLSDLKVDIKCKFMFRCCHEIVVFENNGHFVRRFETKNMNPLKLKDFTCACDGRVIGIDNENVYVYSELGEHLSKFKIKGNGFSGIAFDNPSEHVVIAVEKTNYLYLEIYTKDGKCVRSTQIAEWLNDWDCLRGVAVTTDGRIAVLCNQQGQWKVLIV